MKLTAAVLTFAALAGIASLPLVGCSSHDDDSYNESHRDKTEKSDKAAKASKSADKRGWLETEAAQVVAAFKSTDSTLDRFFNNSAGYVVFPEVAKGGAIIGGAGGDGVVYKNGNVIGYSELSQASIGLQLGGQVYREIIFFENDTALNHFKNGNLEFAAQASAVAAKAGAAANANYHNGVAVFTHVEGGLMFEASIGGQHFSFKPR